MVKVISLAAVGVGIAWFVTYVYETAAVDDIFFRLSVSVLAGLYTGLLFLIFVLPVISDILAKLVYNGSSASVNVDDPMRDARSLLAKGNYVEAVGELRQVVMKHPDNRLAWVEMSKVQQEQLGDAEGAVGTLIEAMQAHEWFDEDQAFFMFRLSDLKLEALEDQSGAVRELQKVCERFPNTKHSANATHKLRELGAL